MYDSQMGTGIITISQEDQGTSTTTSSLNHDVGSSHFINHQFTVNYHDNHQAMSVRVNLRRKRGRDKTPAALPRHRVTPDR